MVELGGRPCFQAPLSPIADWSLSKLSARNNQHQHVTCTVRLEHVTRTCKNRDRQQRLKSERANV